MTEPTDNELDIVLSKHWPAFATVGALPLIWIRAAFREAIAKWGTPPQISESDAAYWLRHRALILRAIEERGFRLVSSGGRFWLHGPSTQAQADAAWNRRAQPAPPAADQEPFGYFRAEPFGWTDCAETDEGAVALYDRPAPPAVEEPPELSPDFTDTARAALLWVLWHHQGGSSPVGQPIRFALGMGQHERLNEHQLAEAKRWERLHPVNPSVFPRGPEPLTDEQIVGVLHSIPINAAPSHHIAFARAIEQAHGIKGVQHGTE